MDRPLSQASIYDEASSQDQDHQFPDETDEGVQNFTTRKPAYSFKARKSILADSNDDKPTFWSINSFEETSTWTGPQQADAVKQAQRLATHYVKLYNEHVEMLTTIQKLQARIESLDLDVRNLQGDNIDLEHELTKKQGTIEYLEQQNRKPSATPSTSTDSTSGNARNTKGRARLEDPEKFSGKKDDQAEFDTWKSNIEAKLKIDSGLFDDENHKIFYVFSRTTYEAQDHIRDRINNDLFSTTKDVLKALEAVYGDPHKAIKAEAELQRLGQTLNGSFHLFYTDFIRIVRPLGYDDEKLKEALISKLNDKYLTAIGSYLDLPYTELVEKLHAIDKRFESQRAARESRKQLNTATANIKPSDKGPRGQAPSTSPTMTTGPRTGTGSSSDKPPIRTRAEFEALHQAGLCKKCCKANHTAVGERCQEKTWVPTPAHIKVAAKELKQINNVEAELEALDPSKN
jgi:hypothetical protein